MAILNRAADAEERWVQLSRYSARHPPLQISVHYSEHLTKQHVAFAETLEALQLNQPQEAGGSSGQATLAVSRSASITGHSPHSTIALLRMFTQRCHQLRFLWVCARVQSWPKRAFMKDCMCSHASVTSPAGASAACSALPLAPL